MNNTFTDYISGKITTLKPYGKYTWYVEVFIDPVWGAKLKVDNVE